ncbi:MAG: hypothetical protein ACYS4W_04525 [Planctomycetota bacterium]|jgi:hypothetical protein
MTTENDLQKRLEGLGHAIGSNDLLIDNVMSSIEAMPAPEANKNLVRRFIMNRFAKLAAAAAIIVAVALSVTIFDKSVTPTYAITDVPGLLKTAETLHTQATVWLYTDDEQEQEFMRPTVVPLESWLDVPNMRERFLSYEPYREANGDKRCTRTEGLRNGEYAIDIRHGPRTVRYNKVSLVKRRLQMRAAMQDEYLNSTSEEISSDPDRYFKVGQEDIKGAVFDIWEREDAAGDNQPPPKKVRCWLSPTSGELARIYVWGKSSRGGQNWRPEYFVEKIERDIDIPDSIFELTPPEDYRYENTKETAFVAEGLGAGWFTMGQARVSLAINFTLDDGTVIVAWHSDHLQTDPYQEQDYLFQGLKPGDELPRLPMVIYGLKIAHPEPDSAPERFYVGRHLGFTKKAGWYYEWALYVSEGQSPKITDGGWYRMLCRFNLPVEQQPEVGNPIPQNRIDPGEFDMFVRTAMAELSDQGRAPENVTYETVIQLADRIRALLKE